MLDVIIYNPQISRTEVWSRASRTCQGINEISFRASCHQELQLNVSDSNARQTLQFARRRIGSSLIDVPNFPESVHRRSGIRVDIFTSFFSSLPLFFHPLLLPFFFFSLRVSPRCTPGVTSVNSRRNCSWKISRSDPSIVDPDGNRVPAGIVLEIAAFNSCVSKIEEGWEEREIWKGSIPPSLTGRRFQIKTTPRRTETRDISRIS